MPAISPRKCRAPSAKAGTCNCRSDRTISASRPDCPAASDGHHLMGTDNRPAPFGFQWSASPRRRVRECRSRGPMPYAGCCRSRRSRSWRRPCRRHLRAGRGRCCRCSGDTRQRDRRRDRLDRDRVLPVVAEVVGAGQLRDAAIHQYVEPHGLRRVGFVAQPIPFGISDGVALSICSELKRDGRLDDVVQGPERSGDRGLDAPPDGGLPVIELDPDAGDAIGVDHATSLADGAFQFHDRRSLSRPCGMSAMRAEVGEPGLWIDVGELCRADQHIGRPRDRSRDPARRGPRISDPIGVSASLADACSRPFEALGRLFAK